VWLYQKKKKKKKKNKNPAVCMHLCIRDEMTGLESTLENVHKGGTLEAKVDIASNCWVWLLHFPVLKII
jgi:hypothetical protein